MKIIIRLFILIAIFFTASCARDLHVDLGSVDFFDEVKHISSDGSSIKIVGYIGAIFSFDKNIIQLAKEESLNISFKAKGCEIGIELEAWPYVYDVSNSDSDSNYEYLVFFSYQFVSDESYDALTLLNSPQDVCLSFVASGMLTVFPYKTRIVRIPYQNIISKKIKDYESTGSPVKVILQDDCARSGCIPEYAL